MTPARLRARLEELTLAPDELAAVVWRTPSTVYKWLRGEHPIPATVAGRLEKIDADDAVLIHTILEEVPEEE